MVSGGTVTGDLGNLKDYFTKLDNEVSGLSGVWKGSSYSNLSSKVEEMVSQYSGVISSEMTSFASACDLYAEYEQVKNQIRSLEGNAEENSSQISSCRARLSQLKTEIESLLSSASAESLEGASSSTLSLSTSALGTPSYGTFEKQSFKASNGLTVNYYLYRPSYNGTVDVEGLPVIMYMHGGGNNNSASSLLARGLSKELNNQSVNPSGICIIPFIQNFSDKRNVQALRELTDTVVSTYHADPNRISVSGHSSGAIMTYKLVNAYPNYYAAAMPISGFSKINDESFRNTRVWAFNGELDKGSATSNAGAAKAVNYINSIGGNATLYTYKGAGHAYVQDYTYQREFESPDGDVTTPLEWAFRQVKKV